MNYSKTVVGSILLLSTVVWTAQLSADWKPDSPSKNEAEQEANKTKSEGIPDASSRPPSPFALPPELAAPNSTGGLKPKPRSPFALPDESTPTPTIGSNHKTQLLNTFTAEELHQRGTQLAKEGQLKQANELLALSLQKDPHSVTALNNLGLVMRKLGQIDEAYQAYERAIASNPNYGLTYKNLGILLEKQGENKKAAQAYRRYSELSPSAADLKDVRARADWLEKKAQ